MAHRASVDCTFVLAQQVEDMVAESTSDELIGAMRELTGQITSGAKLEEVLNFIYERFKQFLPYDRLGYADVNLETNRVTKRWARADGPLLLPIGYSAPLAGSSLAMVLHLGRPRILNDLVDYLKRRPQSDSTRVMVREGFRSSLTCPLMVEKKPLGFLFFTSRQPNTYSQAHAEFFEHIAAELSLYLLIFSEREKTREAIGACAHVFAEFLNISGPQACASTTHVSQLAREIATELRLTNPWRFELAGLLCQVGFLGVSPELVAKACEPAKLSRQEREVLAAACSRGQGLVARIPPLDDVAKMIGRQMFDYADMAVDQKASEEIELIIGASIIRLARDFEQLVQSGLSAQAAIEQLERSEGRFPAAVEALARIQRCRQTFVRMQVGVRELAVDMVLAEPVVTPTGNLVFGAGQRITKDSLKQLQNCSAHMPIQEPVTVLVPENAAYQVGIGALGVGDLPFLPAFAAIEPAAILDSRD